MTDTSQHAAPVDGPFNVTINPQHMRSSVRETRRQQYLEFVDQTKQLRTAAGLLVPFDLKLNNKLNLFHSRVNKWKKDGQVTIASAPCSHCVEINSVRPAGSTPMCCLIRSEYKASRSDGNTACALCFAVGYFHCSARSSSTSINPTTGLRRYNSTASNAAPSTIAASSSKGGKEHISEFYEMMTTFDHGQVPKHQDQERMTENNDCINGFINNTAAATGIYSSSNNDATTSTHLFPPQKSRKSVEFQDFPSSEVEYHNNEPRVMSDEAPPRPDVLKRPSSLSSKQRRANTEIGEISMLKKQVESLETSNKFQIKYIFRLEKDIEEHHSILISLKKKVEEQGLQLIDLQADRVLNRSMAEEKIDRLTRTVNKLHRKKSDVVVNTDTVTRQSSAISRLDSIPVDAIEEGSATSSLDDMIRWIEEREERHNQRKALYLEQLHQEVRERRRRVSIAPKKSKGAPSVSSV